MLRLQSVLTRFLLMAILPVISCGTAKAQESEMKAVEVGDLAPDFTVATDQEQLVELNDYLKQNKLVALVFVRAHW